MNVLALEPWYGGSHRRFLDGLAAHSTHTFRCLTMPGRFWRWRMEGGAITLAEKARQALHDGFVPDVLLASSMVHLPAFLALTRDVLADVPVLAYFHENQLTYPLPPDRSRDRSYSIINYQSALAADHVAFNSRFHFNEFTDALPQLLRTFPDFTNLHTVRAIREKSSVLPLGLNLKAHDAQAPDEAIRNTPPIILWNQRWEYDKNPEAFFRAMNRLDDVGCDFRLILAGKKFRNAPEVFEQAFERYGDRVLHYGYAEDFAAYSRLLHRADVVVSTALHEFFGVAVMEAIYCGCHPVLPNRLSYPELIPDTHHRPLLHAPILYDDEDALFAILRDVLAGRQPLLPHGTLRKIPARFDWSVQHEAFDARIEAVAASDAVPTA
ncbi:tRNA-queuosine alpha-mannosyltransferase domain-containing protein [Salisaeta longa]|uniref:tRNA-queuosine alpha-mannosyltransferase domain-containing protein n=1 Tax=Salisaeta longa TaxID=503170 RepID=UPI0003B4B5B3|nr:DUF3524 domain-containing protein [Salisaeta longa]